MNTCIRLVNRILWRFGYELGPAGKRIDFSAFPDLSDQDKAIVTKVRRYTMTTIERIEAVISATRYVVSNNIPGAIVECGVWRGGSTMAALLTMLDLSCRDRDVYLYDTYEGMPEPGTHDKSLDGKAAGEQLSATPRGTGVWCCATLEDVTANVLATGYPPERIRFVKGQVEKTIPGVAPDGIALLRLDTDWYESTKHELENLMPRLHPRGVIIVDDYGHWSGAKKAIDEYFARFPGMYYFHRIDYTGRVIIKVCA